MQSKRRMRNSRACDSANRYRRRLRLLLILTSLAACPLTGRETILSVEDDDGQQVRLPVPAERIVSLSPHATELVFAAGAGGKLVGASTFSNYPPQAERIPRIGGASRLDRERLLAIRPDLVVAWPSGNRPQDLAWLKKRAIPLYRSEPRTLENIAKNIRDIGLLAGTSASAAAAAAAFSERLAGLRRDFGEKTRLRVFYQIWPKPLMTAGTRHFINQVLALCRGQPLFPGLSALTPMVSREAVIQANPQAIIAASPEPGSEDPFAYWRRWRSIDSVRENRLISVHPDLIHRPTPRILDGAEVICRGLHPGTGNP